MRVYSEKEWFRAFYPKEWGDWTKSYNIKGFRENREMTPCTWLDYCLTGFVSGEDPQTGLMAVNKSSFVGEYRLDQFFVSCDSKSSNIEPSWFIQPILNPLDQMYYARIRVSKLESNLDLYEIYVSGGDDSSYTKHFIGRDDLNAEVKNLRENGIDHVHSKDSQYFFTN